MNLYVVNGPNFSGRTAKLRRWVGLPEKVFSDASYSKAAYIGPDPSASLSGIASTTTGEFELMAADQAAFRLATRALEELGFGYVLEQNPFTLSGGEQVVVAILAAIAGRPERLAIDIALEQLSASTREKLLAFLAQIDGDLMIADNRLGEWYTGAMEEFRADAGAPGVQCGVNFRSLVPPCEIQLVDVCFSYKKHRSVLKDLSVTFEAGRHYLLRGANGSGKTTLSKLLCGLIRPSGGEIRVDGKVVRPWLTPGRFVGYHFQNPNVQLFSGSVREAFGGNGKSELVDLYGLRGLWDEHPLDLPYVLRKRVAVVETLARKVGVKILDEPCIGQDAAFRSTLTVDALGATCISVSHSKAFENLPTITMPGNERYFS